MKRLPNPIHVHHAYSLVEVVIAAGIVSVLAVGALNGLGGVFRTYAITDEQSRVSMLATDLMHEILQSAYEDPNGDAVFGIETGENSSLRSTFDDIDDYHEWNASPPVDRNGNAYTGYSGWQRSVEVVWAVVTDPKTDAADESGLKRILVTVRSPRGVEQTLTALHARTGPLAWHPPENVTYLTGVDVQLSTDDRVPASHGSTSIYDHIEEP